MATDRRKAVGLAVLALVLALVAGLLARQGRVTEPARAVATAPRPPATAVVFAPVPADVQAEKEKLLGINEYLNAHDPCLATHTGVDFKVPDIYPVLMKAPDLYPHEGPKDRAFSKILDALMSKDIEQALAKLRDIQDPDPSILLYRGLLEANMMVGLSNTSPDLREAIADLERARALDPGNGAYAFFLARMKDDAGYLRDDVRDELMRAGAGKRFESYALPLLQRVYEKGLNSPELSLLAVSVISSFPVPDYGSFRMYRDALQGESDPDLLERASNLGKQMMEPTLRYGHEREAVYWIGIEYAVGNNMFKDAWTQTHEGEQIPEPYGKTMGDWFREPGSDAMPYETRYDRALCTNAKLRAQLARDKAVYQEFMKR